MFTVALVGADGAGKTTISRLLEAQLPLPARSIYMGVNLDRSSLMLPTTRLVVEFRRARGSKPDMTASPHAGRSTARPAGTVGRAARSLKSGLRVANWIGEECFRQVFASYLKRRGTIVIFDRHFYADYYAYDIANSDSPRLFASRLHGFFLARLYPKPDLVICLDAPASVLFARKSEASVEWLEKRRREYLELANVLPNFVRIDAGRSQPDVIRDVSDAILDFYRGVARRKRRAAAGLVS